ncbi:uncharacterized protein BYT42DRAFT_501765 [Radiomyces spectabilis]|uniref:uncharacterized protein n=1 Tax=Radiomyces spectabilis TaxID=64574 RepID=UPI00222118D8|nr:uncharacterized protein BYT42DRAFT_501765 [Radiomyces spectabilis]KAI8371571.1 hypothetical protein BYT42DRAFT_501765 [Radiomyces spectabilis]
MPRQTTVPIRTPSDAITKQVRSKSTTTSSSTVAAITTTSSSVVAPHDKASIMRTPTKKANVARQQTSRSSVTSTPANKTLRRKTIQPTVTTDRNDETELRRVRALLEQSRKEKEMLSEQMDGKEAAWERLVSAKESYALRVKERDDEIFRLQQALADRDDQCRRMHEALGKTKATMARVAMADAMEQQYQRRIDKLDTLVRDLQQRAVEANEAHEAKLREHGSQLDQLRRDLAERDQTTACLERECDELRRAGMEALQSYETSMAQIKQDNDLIEEKEDHIGQLNAIIEELKLCNATQISKDDRDDGYKDSRRRLEEQLELTTQELDRERQQMKTLAVEVDQLRENIKQLHRTVAGANAECAVLQEKLEKEIQEKRCLMEEYDAALEAQATARNDYEQISLAKTKIERELAEALKKAVLSTHQQTNTTEEMQRELETTRRAKHELIADNQKLQTLCNQAEQECIRLIDEMLIWETEKVNDAADGENGDNGNKDWLRQLDRINEALLCQRQRYDDLEKVRCNEIHQLSAEITALRLSLATKDETVMTLEKNLEIEKQRTKQLEKQYHEDTRYNRYSTPISPVSMTTFSHRDSSDDEEEVYCEICEVYGHDVIACTAFTSTAEDEEYDEQPSDCMCYCVNCDVFGVHPTEECPNQDETF